MKLYEAIIASNTLVSMRDKEFPFSFAMSSAKIVKEVEAERKIVREVLDKEWSKKYGVSFEQADDKKKQEMNKDFQEKAMEHEFELKTTIDLGKLEEANVMLTTEQVTNLMPLFNEE
jgi:hypothetical protein